MARGGRAWLPRCRPRPHVSSASAGTVAAGAGAAGLCKASFLRPGRAAWQRLIPPAAAPPPPRLSHTRWCSHFLSCHRGPGCLIVFRVPGH